MPDLWQYGVAVGVIGVLFGGIWRSAQWLSPRLDKLLDRHMQFLDMLESEITVVRNNATGTAASLGKLTEIAQSQHTRLERLENGIACVNPARRP